MVESILPSTSSEHSIYTSTHSNCMMLGCTSNLAYPMMEANLSFQTISSDCHLSITDRAGNQQDFYVEKQILMKSSELFQCLFSQKCKLTSDTSTIQEIDLDHSTLHSNHRLTELRLQVPSVVTFEGILKWLYHKNDDQWLSLINEENFDETLANVVFLHLGSDAYDVCTRVFTG
ncbi:hypothetical protein K7432_009649 [Basidiobolus ranarum]|uniref:BTB domain-containing protein n=1 Tax=Basidiobolus ranarum TaxID=34480 RepID=A0ABR2VX62_9FUNG